MPLAYKYEFHPANRALGFAKNYFPNDNQWIAWWYCGIQKNHRVQSQPNALVAFREVLAPGSLSDAVFYQRVPITTLGQVRIGTVWQKGRCCAEAVLDSDTFDIDFSTGKWRHTSFYQAAREGSSLPYPHNIHPLGYWRDKNWLLEFPLPTGGKLVVPCLEFFTRCYGRSAELRRVLTTYSWEECVSKRLYAPLEESEEPDRKWKVKLRKRLVNDDVIILAHAKYQKNTREAVKSIYSQLESQYDSDSNKLAFIKVDPWFSGWAKLKANGIWFDEGRSFLALQITGGSLPLSVPILRGRDNASNAISPLDSGELGTAWAGTPIQKLIKPPEVVDLTDDVEPDANAIPVEIEDSEFEELGERPVVVSMRAERAKSSSGRKGKGTDASSFSSGDPYGKGQGVGYLFIHANLTIESQGKLRDMWNAMLFLKKKLPALIQSVEWFTFNEGYSADAEPRLIGLEPFDEKDGVDSDTRKWVYMDPATEEVKGVLVTRLVIQNKEVHIVEIQRRPQRKGEQSLTGLAFVLDDEADFGSWLRQLLSDVRGVRGVFRRLVGKCPGTAYAFNHAPAGSERVPCEAALLNALNKMGLSLSIQEKSV